MNDCPDACYGRDLSGTCSFRHALLLHKGCSEYRSKATYPLFKRFVACHDAGRICSIEGQAPSFEEQIQLGFVGSPLVETGEGLER